MRSRSCAVTPVATGARGDCDRIELTDDERRRGWEATDDGAGADLSEGHDADRSQFPERRGPITNRPNSLRRRQVADPPVQVQPELLEQHLVGGG